MKKPKTLLERIMARREMSPSGCWLWTGAINGHGYGSIKVAGAVLPVHRVVYDLLVGSVPKKHDVHHACEVKSCFNPAHLALLSRRDHQVIHGGPAAQNAAKTECPKCGGPFELEVDGRRRCKPCHRKLVRERARFLRSA